MNINQDDVNKKQFWRKTTKPVPGRLTQHGINHGFNINSSDYCSYKRFETSIHDVWDNDDDDEFLLISGSKILKNQPNYLVDDIKIHQSKSEKKDISNNDIRQSKTNKCKESTTNIIAVSKMERSESFISKLKPKSYPGKPLPQTCKHISMSQDDINKMKKFENLLESSTLNIECLRQLSWSGIPVKIRAETWRLLTGYTTITPNKRNEILATKRISYKNLVRQCYFIEKDEINQKIYKQIKIDIPRMNPAILIFQQNVVQDIFERILYLWAVRNPTTGYVQGINDLVTPFFVVFLLENIQNENEVENIDVGSVPQEIRDNIEADTFWCLSKFLNHIQENYALSQLGIQKTIDKLRNLIQRIDYTLHNHLISNGVDYLQFSYRWINNLLTRELPLPCIIRLWDTYLAEFESFGTFHLYVCAAFLLHWKDLLLQEIDFQGLILLLQNLPAKNWTVFDIRMLMAEAYRLKFTFEGAPRHLQCYKNS